MWRSIVKVATPLTKAENCLLFADNLLAQQHRTTYILKRRVAPFLHKKGAPPKKLRSRHYVYDLVKDTNVEKLPNIDVILTSYIDTVGNVGDRVSVKPHYAYNNLLLPGLAVYATPENIEKYQISSSQVDKGEHYSSPTALKMMESLSRITLSIILNKENPWTLQPWHVKASFRKCGYIVPEEAIELPVKTIKGPDLSLEDKHFFITVTINNTEKVKVKCRIHHWSTDVVEKLPYEEEFWKKPTQPLFPEDAASPIKEDTSTKNL